MACLEIWVRGRLGSLNMTRFDRPFTISNYYYYYLFLLNKKIMSGVGLVWLYRTVDGSTWQRAGGFSIISTSIHLFEVE